RILSNSASHFTCDQKKEKFIKSTLYMRLYMCEKYSADISYINAIYKSHAKECIVHGVLYPQEHVDKVGFLYRTLLFINRTGLVSQFLILRERLRRFLGG
ncbi:MAG: hypothetical protein ACRCUU_01705, partial [Plesiomonas sp.]